MRSSLSYNPFADPADVSLLDPFVSCNFSQALSTNRSYRLLSFLPRIALLTTFLLPRGYRFEWHEPEGGGRRGVGGGGVALELTVKVLTVFLFHVCLPLCLFGCAFRRDACTPLFFEDLDAARGQLGQVGGVDVKCAMVTLN